MRMLFMCVCIDDSVVYSTEWKVVMWRWVDRSDRQRAPQSRWCSQVETGHHCIPQC